MLRAAPPFPGMHADEKELLADFLDWYRDVLLRKLEGLDREQATRALVPSASTVLGIVKHCAFVERGWFQIRFQGLPLSRPSDSGDDTAEFRVSADESIKSIVDLYQSEVAQSRAIVAAASLDERARKPSHAQYSLRWIMVHMIEETARHAGQLDILREQIDGATGE
jgi:uncharacterized damage-inducible protein DinB